MKTNTELNDIVVIIPAFKPDDKLFSLVKDLKEFPVLVIDDGSGEQYSGLFTKILLNHNCRLIRSKINYGKGHALKVAFNFIYKNKKNILGVVTADSDGQHLAEDIKKIIFALRGKPDQLSIGVRNFSGKIPLRSLIGNFVTKYSFFFLSGKKIADTQTGLRGIPIFLLSDFSKINANKYDYEMEMLLFSINKKKIKINEVNINTVYFADNAKSHFNPLIDSIKIYYVFIRFFCLSIITAILDYSIFFLIHSLTANILYAFIFAKSGSVIFNFSFSKKKVFFSEKSFHVEFIKYIFLVLVLMFTAYFMTFFLVKSYHFNVILSKMLSEGSLFFISFFAQRLFVFNSKSVNETHKSSQIK